MKDDPPVKALPPEVATTPSPLPDATEPLGLSKEDWFIIDEALHRVARSLRKIEREEKRKQLQQEAEGQLPADQ